MSGYDMLQLAKEFLGWSCDTCTAICICTEHPACEFRGVYAQLYITPSCCQVHISQPATPPALQLAAAPAAPLTPFEFSGIQPISSP